MSFPEQAEEKRAMRYEFIENNLRNLEGKVLTIVDAALDGDKNKAVKDLIREKFGHKMKWFRDVATKEASLIEQDYEDNSVPIEK